MIRSNKSVFFISVITFVLAYGYYLYAAYHVPIDYWDEHVWVGQGYYLDLLVRGDNASPLWHSYHAYDQPKFAAYLLNIPSYIQFRANEPEQRHYWQYLIDNHFVWIAGEEAMRYVETHYPINWKSIQSRSSGELEKQYGAAIKPTISIILSARAVSALFMALTVVVVWHISILFFPVSLTSGITLMFMTNSLFIYSGSKAMAEGIFLFLIISGLYLICRFVVLKEGMISALRIGLISGIAAQTKLNGLVLMGIFSVVAIAQAIRTFQAKNISWLIMSWLACFGIFCLLNPFLYTAPIKNTLYMYRFRYMDSVSYQKRLPDEALLTPSKRMGRIIRHFYVDIDTNFGIPFGLYKWETESPNSALVRRAIKALLLVRLFGATFGIAYILYNSISATRIAYLHKKTRNELLFFAILTMLMSAPLGYLLMDWQSYYVVYIYPIISLEVYGIYIAVSKASVVLRRNQKYP